MHRRRQRALLLGVAALIALLAALGPVVRAEEGTGDEVVLATVVQVQDEGWRGVPEASPRYQVMELVLRTGSQRGQHVLVEQDIDIIAKQIPYGPGDDVWVSSAPDAQGQPTYYVMGYSRVGMLLLLFGVFAGVVVLVGRGRGARSLLGLAVSFVVVFVVIVPRVLDGASPVATSLFGGLLALPPAYLLSHGVNRKTLVALAASLVGLLATALLAQVLVGVMSLAGWGSEEVGLLAAHRPGTFDVQGLLVAGIVISVLGVLDDVTVAQAGVVEQLHAANPAWKWEELYRRAMHVGQDHIASMVNTLVLVYAGSSLPLLLIFTELSVPIGYMLSSDVVAEELVQMLVTSSGLVATVPLTTLAAALVMARGLPTVRARRAPRKKPLPYE